MKPEKAIGERIEYKGFYHPDIKFTEKDQKKQGYKYGYGPKVRVGEYEISEFWTPYNGPAIWIGEDGGEGGEFTLAHFEKFLKKYYNENF